MCAEKKTFFCTEHNAEIDALGNLDELYALRTYLF